MGEWRVRTAVISGGASGIGLAAAKALAADGANIALLDLSVGADVVNEIEACCRDREQQLVHYEVDIVDAAAVRQAVADSVDQLGAPDFALNCAGINITDNFERITDAQFARVINVNLLGSRNFAVAVLPTMSRGARLVLLASMGGLTANYAYSAYSSSKFGVVGLADVLRTEYAPLGIGISVVCPPEVPTPMVEEEMKHMHPVQRVLKDSAGLVELDKLVPYFLDQALIHRRYRIIPGARARLMFYLSRWLPQSVFNGYIDNVVRKTFARHPDAPRR